MLIEKRMPWFAGLPIQRALVGRAASSVFALLFGQPKRLDEAVRIRTNEQPWSSTEVVATAWMFASITSTSAILLLLNDLSAAPLLAVAMSVGLVTYRVWIWQFVKRANARRKTIRRFLPHAMDSIAMVIGSGDPFRSGLDTVILDFPDHPLSQEFSRLRNNLDRGQTMHAALSAAAHAICLPEFDELVRVLGRIHSHGVPAAENFTRLAKGLRVAHLRFMEEEVGRAEASMSLPTMLVMLACMVVSVAPFVLSLMESDILR